MTEASPSGLLAIPKPSREGEGDALRTLRDEAEAALRQHGLPGRRDEAWRFTPTQSAAELEADGAPTAEQRAAVADGLVEGATLPTLAIVDGIPHLDPAALAGLPEGVTASWLDEGEIEPVSLAEPRHFRALNQARFERGLLLRVRGVVSTPIVLAYGSAGGRVANARVHVELETGAALTLEERFELPAPGPEAKALLNTVTDVRVGANAELEHVRLHRSDRMVIGSVAAEVRRDARYRSRVVSLGGPLTRLDLHVAMVERGASCVLDGAYHVNEKDLVDHHTFVEHRAPNCTSNQDYRGVIDGHGTAIFDGIAKVHRGATESEAHQKNQNLLVSERATVHTKPHLEIDTDSVVASHGATVGTLDDDALFYLRSRGVSRERARAVLTFAFVKELLDRLPAAVRLEALGRFAERLSESDGLLSLFGDAAADLDEEAT